MIGGHNNQFKRHEGPNGVVQGFTCQCMTKSESNLRIYPIFHDADIGKF